MSKVFAKTLPSGTVIAINSDDFLPDTTGWVEVDEGYGDKYRYAQGNYLPQPLMDDRGRYQWRISSDNHFEMLPEQYRTDRPNPTCGQDGLKLIKAEINALADMEDMIEECLVEMAQVVYE